MLQTSTVYYERFQAAVKALSAKPTSDVTEGDVLLVKETVLNLLSNGHRALKGKKSLKQKKVVLVDSLLIKNKINENQHSLQQLHEGGFLDQSEEAIQKRLRLSETRELPSLVPSVLPSAVPSPYVNNKRLQKEFDKRIWRQERQNIDALAQLSEPESEDEQQQNAAERPMLVSGKNLFCYICKQEFEKPHTFYHKMCETCGAFNYEKRTQKKDLSSNHLYCYGSCHLDCYGSNRYSESPTNKQPPSSHLLADKIAILTGGRVKIGFQAGLLLRSGCFVILTSRFPKDTLRR